MMAHKHKQQHLLNDLLKENQEPFHLKSYIAEKRSQFKNNNSLQLKKRVPKTSITKHACFLTFQNSPDVKTSPFYDFKSPSAMSPKSPNRAALFLHIPSRTAALLVEAAMRIQKQQNSKPKLQSKKVGFGLFGSFLKRLKDRSKIKKRVIGGNEISFSRKNEKTMEEKTMDFDDQASTSSCCSECSEKLNSDFDLPETRFCSSPFRFSLHISPSSSGRRTPEFCSPAESPTRHVQQENVNCETQNLNNVHGEDEEEKEQCSPVSVLDPPFEDDGHESGDADEDDDYDLECSYANVQRAKQQLLYRLRRFEELAELDPMELEKKLVEGSDGEDIEETEEYEDEKPYACSPDTFVTEVFNQSSLQDHSTKMSTDMKRLVTDLIVEEKRDTINSGNNEVVLGRIRNRLDSWKEVEFNTIDMMVELDFKRDFDGWRKFPEQGEEMVAEIEASIFGLLMKELSEELLQHQELNVVPIEST